MYSIFSVQCAYLCTLNNTLECHVVCLQRKSFVSVSLRRTLPLVRLGLHGMHRKLLANLELRSLGDFYEQATILWANLYDNRVHSRLPLTGINTRVVCLTCELTTIYGAQHPMNGTSFSLSLSLSLLQSLHNINNRFTLRGREVC